MLNHHSLYAILNVKSVGRPKHKRVMAGAVEGDYFVGRKAEELRGLLKVSYPLEHGVVKDWNDMENIWQYAYNELRCQPEEVIHIICCYIINTSYSNFVASCSID